MVRVSTEGTGLSPSIRSMEQGQWTDRQDWNWPDIGMYVGPIIPFNISTPYY